MTSVDSISVGSFVTFSKSHLFSPAEAAAREFWARRFITEFTGVSRGLGYGVFSGGSLIRDIDLVAVPWRDGPKFLTHLDYVLELMHCLPLQMGNHSDTLFGHKQYCLWETSHLDHQIDLKVMLPVNKGEV